MTMFVFVLGWVVALGLLAVSATQLLGFDQWRPVAVLQAMSPYLLAMAAPLGVAAAATGNWTMALVSLVPLLTLAWLVAPAVRARRAPGVDDRTVTLFFGNLLAHNPKVPSAMQTVADTDADVLVLTEFTPCSANNLFSTRLATSSLATKLAPSGNHTSTMISGRLESGKNCCWTLPMPTMPITNKPKVMAMVFHLLTTHQVTALRKT